MKKRICSVLLALSLTLGMLPATALAADPVKLADGDFDFRNEKTSQSDANWNWDAKDRILELNDFQGVVEAGVKEESAAILLPKDSILWLEGDSEITIDAYRCNGIFAAGNLTVAGDGTLKITVDSPRAAAFRIDGGVLTLEDEAEVTVDVPKYAVFIYNLTKNKVAVSVYDKAKLTFPDDMDEDAVTVVTKSNVDTSTITFDYEEAFDKADKTVSLVKAEKKPAEEPEEKPEESTPPANNTPDETLPPDEAEPPATYRITIGKAEIVKDGVNAYTADVLPYISAGYTMLPLRALLVLSEPNVEIQWDSPAKTATITYGDNTVTVIANAAAMTKNGESVPMSTAAQITDGRLFVSLRDWMRIMEIPTEQVSWDSASKTVTLQA